MTGPANDTRVADMDNPGLRLTGLARNSSDFRHRDGRARFGSLLALRR